MFNNPGKKIQTLCKIVFWLIVIAAIIIGIAMMIMSANNGNFGIGLLLGIVIIGAGILIAWLDVLVLFAFGKLVESNEEIAYYVKNGK